MPFPVALSFAADLPFKFVGGDASVDLVNTVDWTRRGLIDDRLTDYERLTRWAEGAGALTARQGAQLRSLALAHPRLAERAHRDALDLRWQLRELFTASNRGESLGEVAALGAFNRSLGDALARLELAAQPRAADTEAPLRWSWRDAEDRLESVLWPVVRSAAELLVSEEASRIHECASEDCGWMYVDRSRNGLRRWCQMETCGNREKSRRRAERR
jgi:predicted RNA-binding Zn ribbon-like protein